MRNDKKEGKNSWQKNSQYFLDMTYIYFYTILAWFKVAKKCHLLALCFPWNFYDNFFPFISHHVLKFSSINHSFLSSVSLFFLTHFGKHKKCPSISYIACIILMFYRWVYFAYYKSRPSIVNYTYHTVAIKLFMFS